METAVIEKISNVARVKADYAKSSFLKCFVYSMFAGAYIGIGITLIFTLGAQISGSEYTVGLTKLVMGASFGLALSMCIMCGSDLFTGNNLLMGVGAMTRRVSWLEAFHVWGINLIGNLAGSLLVAWIIKMSGLLNNCLLYTSSRRSDFLFPCFLPFPADTIQIHTPAAPPLSLLP